MKSIKNSIVLLLVVYMPFGLTLWFRQHESSGFATKELILYPLLFGGGLSVLLVLLKKFYLKEPLSDFNSGPKSWKRDILAGLILTSIYFALFFLFRFTLMDVLEFKSNTELLGLMLDLRESPFLLFLWFGPVLWIGIGLFEELIRIFMLTSLWSFSKNKIWTLAVILITSIIIGLVHNYQGTYGIVTIGIKSLVSCIYFFKERRIFPLIFAHVLYDGLQVGMLLLTYPE